MAKRTMKKQRAFLAALSREQFEDRDYRRQAKRKGWPLSRDAAKHEQAIWFDNNASAFAERLGSGENPLIVIYEALIAAYQEGYRKGCDDASSAAERREARQAAAAVKKMGRAWKANSSAAAVRRAKYAKFFRSIPASKPMLERLRATANHFGVHPNTIRNALR